MIYLTTDTHFGHKKMMEYCGRPANFAEIILANLQLNTGADDILIHLGDFCMGRDAYWHETYFNDFRQAYTPSRNYLILGNHDRKTMKWYLDHGWDAVCDRMDLYVYGTRVALSHKPLKDDGSYDINIHGHFHNNAHHAEPEFVAMKSPRQVLLAIEDTDYMPVSLQKMIESFNLSNTK